VLRQFFRRKRKAEIHRSLSRPYSVRGGTRPWKVRDIVFCAPHVIVVGFFCNDHSFVFRDPFRRDTTHVHGRLYSRDMTGRFWRTRRKKKTPSAFATLPAISYDYYPVVIRQCFSFEIARQTVLHFEVQSV